MPVKYLRYDPDTVEGQAILGNVTRTRRVLRYQGNDRPLRGLPLYEATPQETIGNDLATPNLLLRGECLSACAYLKDKGVTIDLVYIDPPFASGADYAKSVYLRRHPRKAQALAQAEQELELDELRSFEEKMYGDIWNKEDYLNWMFENLMAIKAVMSETASIYVHLDWHIGHYVKVLMDEVFGENNFVNEIVWQSGIGDTSDKNKKFIKSHDTIFFYEKGSTHIWNDTYQKYSASSDALYNLRDEGGEYRLAPVDNPGGNGYVYDLGFGEKLPANGYRMPKTTALAWLSNQTLIVAKGKVPSRKLYKSEKGVRCRDTWTDISGSITKEYATQKPEALLERIIKVSSDRGMIVADFFGGSGVTAKVAHDLGRTFIHADVGVNSLQTTRDRLRAAGAAFRVLDIQDGVSLFRNPVQTMDKLKTLVIGLKAEAGLDKFWEGAIQDSKKGLMPVYLPNLLDHQTKVVDVPLLNDIIQKALPELPEGVTHTIVYYVDIADRLAAEKFIKDQNMTGVEIELRDLKEVLDQVVLNDEVEYTASFPDSGGLYVVEITRFISDRLQQKIAEYNAKKGQANSARTPQMELDEGNGELDEDLETSNPVKYPSFKPIQISDDGLELIEWISLDCTNTEGAWQSFSEIKIDKKGFVSKDGKSTKAVWDAKISSLQQPLRLKLRSIAGDESIFLLTDSVASNTGEGRAKRKISQK